MGSVWLARIEGKHGFERLVAIKTVLPQHMIEERYRKMFLDEARLASQIQHPNVAQTLDLGESNGVLYFVMEWVDGDSVRKLRNVVNKKGAPFPIGIALRICADACSGMHTAHELRGEDGELLNVVHRDISPHNILVSVTGVTKVIDFGIAKARERLAEETHTDELKGKVDYMAPEQAIGPSIDRRTDVWSLGAVLYYLVGGLPPFDADTKVASLMMRIEGKPPAPLPESMPQQVRDVIAKALMRKPEDRFASAAEMHRAIEEAMSACGAIATAADVAEFMKAHLVDSVDHRKRAVQAALDAAAERHKKSAQLAAPIDGPRSAPELDVVEAGLSLGSATAVPGSHTTRAVAGARAGEETSAAPVAAPEPRLQLARRFNARTGALAGSAAALLVVLIVVARASIVGSAPNEGTSGAGDVTTTTQSSAAPGPATTPPSKAPGDPSAATGTKSDLDPPAVNSPPPRWAVSPRPGGKSPAAAPQQSPKRTNSSPSSPKRSSDPMKPKVHDDGF
jgi:serine/threonine-protein kinase